MVIKQRLIWVIGFPLLLGAALWPILVIASPSSPNSDDASHALASGYTLVNHATKNPTQATVPSDPSAVVDFLQTIDAPDGQDVRHTATNGTALYVATRQGDLLTFDTSNLSDGILLQTPTSVFGPGVLIVVDDYLYVGGAGGIMIFNVSTPLQPTPHETVFSDVRVEGMTLAGARLFVVGNQTVSVIDVSSPDSPTMVNQTEIPGDRLWNIAATEDHVAISFLGPPFDSRDGFALYEVLDSGQVAERSFVDLSADRERLLPYHLFFRPGSILTSASGMVQAYSIEDDQSLTLTNQFAISSTSGRAATIFDSVLHSYVLTNGSLFRIVGSALEHVASFPPSIGQVDGFPFTASVSVDNQAFIPGNAGVAVYMLNLLENMPTCKGLPATIAGNGFQALLQGTAGADVIVGTNGEDIILGMGGNDIVCAGDGDDIVYGGNGLDWIDGGAGNDTLLGGTQRDILLGRGGADLLRGGLGNDKLVGHGGNDGLFGGDGKDMLIAGGGADMVAGGKGDDTLKCGPGLDFADGGLGVDTEVSCENKARIP